MSERRRIARHCLSILATVLVAVALPGAWAAEPRPEIGVVDRVQGSAAAIYVDETRSLGNSDPIYLDDRLVTEAGARLRVRLTDDSELTLGENAEILVDRFVYDPALGKGSTVVRAMAGAFLFVGGFVERLPRAEVKIVTPVATLGIRGTTAWGGAIDGQYGVLVLAGVVTVATEAGQVTLTPGMGTSIAALTTAPSPPKRWPDEKVSRAIATVEFND